MDRVERTMATAALALAVVGCGAGDDAAELGAQRRMLSEGYTMLYVDAGHLAMVRYSLYFKVESDAVDAQVSAVSKFGGELKVDLERIAGDYPGVRIDLDPLPEIEKRKRWAMGSDRFRQFLPVIGGGGREFERTLLIALVNGINHESHLCTVMAEEETEASLRKFLRATAARYEALGAGIQALLEAEYYRDADGASRG